MLEKYTKVWLTEFSSPLEVYRVISEPSKPEEPEPSKFPSPLEVNRFISELWESRKVVMF